MLYHDSERLLEWLPGQHEHFVPLHPTDLIEFLVTQPVLARESFNKSSHRTTDLFRQFAALVLALQHHLYRLRHSRLLYVYAPLDPDLDRMLARSPTDAQRDALDAELLSLSQQLLLRANYRKLTREDINNLLQATSLWGVRMRIQFDLQKWMEVYVRGSAIGTRTRRNWRNYFRKEDEQIPLYPRLVVLFRPNEGHPQKLDHRYVYLRMFKNVPHHRIDMMLPGAGVQMSWLDHTRVVLPSLYSAGMAFWRGLRYLFILALFGVFKTIGIAVIVVVAVIYAVKNLFAFRSNVHQRYMLNVTQRLFYQSLDNNAGVLLRLLEEGEHQEACEAILTYFAMLQTGDEAVSHDELNRSCTELLQEAAGVTLDFDASSALGNLTSLGVVRKDEENWTALPLMDAIVQLDRVWDDWYQPPKAVDRAFDESPNPSQ